MRTLPLLLAACAASDPAPAAAPTPAAAPPAPVIAAAVAEPARSDAEHWSQQGDEAFARGDVAAARAAFARAAASDEPHARAYARYRLGWCELTDGRAIEALDAFVHAVRETAATGQPEAMTRLHREALRDSTLAYAQAGRPERAVDFYLAIDPALAQAALATLIEHYRTRGDAEAVASLCRDSRVQACAGLRSRDQGRPLGAAATVPR